MLYLKLLIVGQVHSWLRQKWVKITTDLVLARQRKWSPKENSTWVIIFLFTKDILYIVRIFPFYVYIERGIEVGRNQWFFKKSLAKSEGGGDLDVVLCYTSADSEMLRKHEWTRPFWMELNRERECEQDIIAIDFQINRNQSISKDIYIYISLYTHIYTTYIFHKYTCRYIWTCTYYIHGASPSPHTHYRSELMINLELVTVKKQFNSDVLNSRSALLINLMH